MPDNVHEIAEKLWNEPQFHAFRTDRELWDKIRNCEEAVPIPDPYKNTKVEEYRSYEAQYDHKIKMQEMARARPVYQIHSRSLRTERRAGAQRFEQYANQQLLIWKDVADSAYLLTSSDQVGRGLAIYHLSLRTEPKTLEDGTTKYDVWASRPTRDGQTAKAYSQAVDEYKLRSPTPFVL